MGDDLLSPTRRKLLRLAALGTVCSALSGCRFLATKPPSIMCRTVPERPEPLDSRLTIDTHCHVFNGSDLQVKQFFDLIVSHEKGLSQDVVRVFADLLQDLVWAGAPDGEEELRVLRELRKCSNGGVILANLKEKHYQEANKAIRRTKAFTKHLQQTSQSHSLSETRLATADSVLSEIDQRLRPNYDDYVRTRENRKQTNGPLKNLSVNATAGNRTLSGMLDYFVQEFQYRYISVQDYIGTFCPSFHCSVDLLLAHMVDYDWWLSKGKNAKTPLPKQVEVMEQISLTTRGRVHGFVPFDPLREVAFLAQKRPSTYSSMGLVKDAVMNRGCIGVKLYPPMGFAPYGNSTISTPHFWKRDELPNWMDGLIRYPGDNTSVGIGQRMDDALAALYDWCCENEVPIMAHSNMTNGPAPEFQALTGSHYWQEALEKSPKLRISFGHLGDFSDLGTAPNNLDATKLVALMSSEGRHPHVYADTGYFPEVLDQTEELAARVKSFYESPDAVLPRRFMYGTDWSLLMNQGDVSSYLEHFTNLFGELDVQFSNKDGLEISQRFFGYNAVEWIGLRKGERARQRLESFYSAHGIDSEKTPPDWMIKVDKFPRGTAA